MDLGDLNKVWEIKALKKVGEDEARHFLEKIAKQVQPIMRKHNWRVKLLSEFCPNNPSLLGLNVGGGVQVKLRLRRPNRDWDFIPFDQVLDTMLHELCHNVHGPHNANFYKLWDEIRKECEELMAKGISGSGQGFDLPGKRLGGFSRQPPLSSLRQTALSAAEKRAQLGVLLPSGPKRLGGDATIKNALSPIQAAAMAAERRLQDDIWCGSQAIEAGGEEEANTHVLTGKNAESSRSPTVSSGQSLNVMSRKRSHDADSSSCQSSMPSNRRPTFVDLTVDTSISGSSSREDAIQNAEEPNMWECGTCTLLNPPLAPICELCSTQRPRDICNKYKHWSCKFCTLENSVKVEKCLACGQWRYSNGEPVATRAPNVDT